MKAEHLVNAQSPELLPALGAAMMSIKNSLNQTYSLHDLINIINIDDLSTHSIQNRHKPLFESAEQYLEWYKNRKKQNIEHIDIKSCRDHDCFLGIDSGSTTTKIVLIDDHDRIICDYYFNNDGNSIMAVRKGLDKIRQAFKDHGFLPKIVASMVTGYVEDLIRTVFDIDSGVIETLAHFRTAKAFDKDVTFILDIGRGRI